MKWIRFWKTVQGYKAGEDYRQFEDDVSEDDIKEELDYWAEYCVSGGSNAGYRYGCEDVERPPKEFLIMSIRIIKSGIKSQKEQLKEYEFWLNTYSVKAKIDKIKDNIK